MFSNNKNNHKINLKIFYYLRHDITIINLRMTVSINPRKIEERIRSRLNFKEFLEHKELKFFPMESCFNTSFILKYLKGEKDFLPLTASNPPILKAMKKHSNFDKRVFLDLILNDERMCKFVPDSVNANRFKRETLIAVSFN